MATENRERLTDSDRISRLEGAQVHMATKADLAALETRVTEKLAASETRLIKWMIGIGVSVVVTVVSLIIAALTVLYRLLS